MDLCEFKNHFICTVNSKSVRLENGEWELVSIKNKTQTLISLKQTKTIIILIFNYQWGESIWIIIVGSFLLNNTKKQPAVLFLKCQKYLTVMESLTFSSLLCSIGFMFSDSLYDISMFLGKDFDLFNCTLLDLIAIKKSDALLPHQKPCQLPKLQVEY